MKEYSAILKALKQASIFDVFLISFLLLPFVFQAWLKVLAGLAVSRCGKFWWLAAVSILYVVGVVAMFLGSSRTKKREVAKDQVVAYLQGIEKTMVRLETIREKINPGYDDQFLESLTVAFPQELRRARLKGNRPGLARIVEEQD